MCKRLRWLDGQRNEIVYYLANIGYDVISKYHSHIEHPHLCYLFYDVQTCARKISELANNMDYFKSFIKTVTERFFTEIGEEL